jgi:hypothetical protein
MKLRIVKLIHRVDELKRENGSFSIEYIVQKKSFWGIWKEVMSTELKPKRISHKTYEEAEVYIFINYMGHGMCEVVGNEYEYIQYTYRFC